MFQHILQLIWNKKRSNLLLFSEIFFSFLLIFAGATFCIQNFRAYFSPIGFETEPIWHLNCDKLYELDSTAIVATKRLLKQELKKIPGVEAVAFSGYALPFSGSMWGWGSDKMGFDFWTSIIGGDEDIQQIYHFDIREGRAFLPEDQNSKYEPVIVNRLIQQKYWNDQSIVDSLLVMGEDQIFKVVGVAENIRYQRSFEAEKETILRFGKDDNTEFGDLLLRVAAGSGAALEAAIGKQFASIMKTENFTISSMHKARQGLDRETWIPIVVFLCIAAFIILNVALGLFGILFYNIQKRRGEIGVRLAMGASQGAITRQFTLEVFFVALAAMLLGSVFAIQVPLLDLIPDDEFGHSNFYYAILFTLVFISAVVVLCAYFPSRQGANLHPAVALHEE